MYQVSLVIYAPVIFRAFHSARRVEFSRESNNGSCSSRVNDVNLKAAGIFHSRRLPVNRDHARASGRPALRILFTFNLSATLIHHPRKFGKNLARSSRHEKMNIRRLGKCSVGVGDTRRGSYTPESFQNEITCIMKEKSLLNVLT